MADIHCMTLENAVVLSYKPHSKMAVWFAKESFLIFHAKNT